MGTDAGTPMDGSPRPCGRTFVPIPVHAGARPYPRPAAYPHRCTDTHLHPCAFIRSPMPSPVPAWNRIPARPDKCSGFRPSARIFRSPSGHSRPQTRIQPATGRHACPPGSSHPCPHSGQCACMPARSYLPSFVPAPLYPSAHPSSHPYLSLCTPPSYGVSGHVPLCPLMSVRDLWPRSRKALILHRATAAASDAPHRGVRNRGLQARLPAIGLPGAGHGPGARAATGRRAKLRLRAEFISAS